MQKNDRIVQLLYRRLKGLPLNLDENQELDAWLTHSESNRRIYETLSNEEWLKEAKAKYFAPGKEAGLIQLREELFSKTTRQPFRWTQLSIAASILILLTIGIYYFLIPTKKSTQTQLTFADLKNQLEILPGGEAILTLSNGSKIPLRKHANGVLAQLGDGKQLIKQDGKLVYQSAVAQYTAGGVDTTTDPRSDQYSVMLPDGSRVWLNRGSTLLYPNTFAADARMVQLVGEGYFEIAKLTDKNQQRIPFIVKTAQENGGEPVEVQVLGTHFNVFAYKGEPVTATLAEGKVNVKRGQLQQLLEPGQQAIVNGGESIELKKNINLDKVMAWKKYQFNFKDQSISEVMKEISYWYGNGFIIKGEINKSITITTDRNKPLSELLGMLEDNGYAHFTMSGTTINVLP